MTWTKLADNFHAHPKLLAVGLAGTGLFARALSYAADYLTDGRIPVESRLIRAACVCQTALSIPGLPGEPSAPQRARSELSRQAAAELDPSIAAALLGVLARAGQVAFERLEQRRSALAQERGQPGLSQRRKVGVRAIRAHRASPRGQRWRLRGSGVNAGP